MTRVLRCSASCSDENRLKMKNELRTRVLYRPFLSVTGERSRLLMCHCLNEVSFSPQQRSDAAPGWNPEQGRRNHNPVNVFKSMSTFVFTHVRFYGEVSP